MEQYLEFKDGQSNKFWAIQVEGCRVTTRWGKIGTGGQSKSKDYPDPDSALREAREQLASKLKGGYSSPDSPVEAPKNDAVSKIESWLAARAPKFLRAMDRGPGPEQLADFETTLGVALPTSLRRFLGWRGQENATRDILTMRWPYGEKLSLAEVRSLHQMECQSCSFAFTLEESGWTYPLPPDWYVADCWDRLWVPLFFDQGNDWATVLVDLGGSFGGQPGQVILKQGAGENLCISLLSDNLENYLEVLHQSMEAGLWVVSETIEPADDAEFDEFVFERLAQSRPFEVYPNQGLAAQARAWMSQHCEISRGLEGYLDASAPEFQQIDHLKNFDRPGRELSLIHWELCQLLLSRHAADQGKHQQALDYARRIRWTVIEAWEGELASRLLKHHCPALPKGSHVSQEQWLQAPHQGRPQFAWQDQPQRARLSYPIGGLMDGGCMVHCELELQSGGHFSVLHLSQWPLEAWVHLHPLLRQELSPSEIAQHLAKAAYHLFQLGKAGEAMALLDKALEIGPEDSLAGKSREALKNKGAEAQGETYQAITAFVSYPPPKPRDFVLQPHPCLWWTSIFENLLRVRHP